MQKVGLFYGSNTGNTEMDSDVIKNMFEFLYPGKVQVDVYNIGTTDIKKIEEYKFIIIGSPTWNIGELQDDWALKFDSLSTLNMQGRLVAMYGVGDQFGYPDNFCDAIGLIGSKMEERGAELVGFTDATEYEFSNSLGVEDGVFLGMALDDDNQGSKTKDRVEYWVDQLMYDFGFIESPVAPAVS
ncbi:MAG: flavodoxin [Chloroflexota bacterium]